MRVKLIDERNATEEIHSCDYRIMFVDGTTHWTYTAYEALDLIEVQEWVQEHVGERQYAIYLEIPNRAVPSTVALIRLLGNYIEDALQPQR